MDFVSNYPSITGEEDSSFVSTHSTLHDYDKQITARSIPNQRCFEDQHGFLLKNESEEEGKKVILSAILSSSPLKKTKSGGFILRKQALHVKKLIEKHD
jgi:hypothetical protein